MENTFKQMLYIYIYIYIFLLLQRINIQDKVKFGNIQLAYVFRTFPIYNSYRQSSYEPVLDGSLVKLY